MRCTVIPMLLQKVLAPCNLAAVTEEAMEFLGCKTLSIWQKIFASVEKQHSAIIVKKFSAFLQNMAISMPVDTPMGKHDGPKALLKTIDAVGSTSYVRIPTQSPVILTYSTLHRFKTYLMCHFHCHRAQGYTDNIGLGPIISRHLEHKYNEGQVLVLMINQLGDHQMETYFNSTDNSGGMVCEGEASMEDVFTTIKESHEESFQDIGGNYSARDKNEKTCAIRLPPHVFFKVLFGLAVCSCWEVHGV